MLYWREGKRGTDTCHGGSKKNQSEEDLRRLMGLGRVRVNKREEKPSNKGSKRVNEWGKKSQGDERDINVK